MRAIRLTLAAFCLIAAIWPAALGVRLFTGVVWPEIANGPEETTYFVVTIFGLALTGWKINTAVAVLGFIAAGMLTVAFFLVFPKGARLRAEH